MLQTFWKNRVHLHDGKSHWNASLKTLFWRGSDNTKHKKDITRIIGENMFIILSATKMMGSLVGVRDRWRYYWSSREDDRFGVIAKVLAFGTEGAQIEMSFLHTLAIQIVQQRILHHGPTGTGAKSKNVKQRADCAGSGTEQSQY
ncbi:hypothetical protein TNCV_1179631 [Trichonephila clavipes]|nr:hypothetical protein TNCV_1179631 [Trichonephila clavipes]